MSSSASSHPLHPFASPNAIPPRTSSNGLSANRHHSAAVAAAGHPKGSSVLRPLKENEWLGQSKKARTSRSVDGLNKAILHYRSKSNSLQRRPFSTARPVCSHAMLPEASHLQPAPVHETDQTDPTDPTDPTDGPEEKDVVCEEDATWTPEKERILLGPYDYLYGHPGKDIRSQCIDAFNLWLQVPPSRLDVITRVVGMLHTASLLVDDVEDSSLLRRGMPAAHWIFGTPQTINSANYVYFKALQNLMAMQNPKLIEIFTQELLNLHRGQGMDLYWRDSLICPTEEDYLQMVGNKTGGLFRLAVKLMQAESAVEIDCTPLVSTIGLLFQILDDHLNLSPTSELQTLKGLCEDLTEGKFSFPVIHAIRADPNNQILINILKQKTTDVEVKKYALKYMQSKGSFDYSARVIDDLRGKVEQHISRIESRVERGSQGAEALRMVLKRLVLR